MPRPKTPEIVTHPADAFLTGQHADHYRFPFTPLDPTPGGRNLGRIEWHLEVFPEARKTGHFRRIDHVLLWATQTYDERYAKRIFKLPCHSEQLTFSSYGGSRVPYVQGVWSLGFCAQHNQVATSSYPPSNATALVVDFWLATAGTLYYEVA